MVFHNKLLFFLRGGGGCRLFVHKVKYKGNPNEVQTTCNTVSSSLLMTLLAGEDVNVFQYIKYDYF